MNEIMYASIKIKDKTMRTDFKLFQTRLDINTFVGTLLMFYFSYFTVEC